MKDEISAATRQMEESKRTLDDLVNRRSEIQRVRNRVGQSANPTILIRLDLMISELSQEIDKVDGIITGWKEVLAVLRRL